MSEHGFALPYDQFTKGRGLHGLHTRSHAEPMPAMSEQLSAGPLTAT